MVVVLRLDERDGDIRLVVENKVGLLGLAARDQFAANDDPALGEMNLLANLQHLVPSRELQGGQDELRADVAFGEASLIHRARRILLLFKSKSSICTDANQLHRCEPANHANRVRRSAAGENPRLCRRAAGSGFAFAENTMTTEPSTGSSAVTNPSSSLSTSQWLASDFYKAAIYDPSENKIGNVTNLIIDSNGTVTAAIISVGRFVGVNQKEVVIPFKELQVSTRDGSSLQ
jgi:sporulation protein YlmC with PRC-barrel domain